MFFCSSLGRYNTYPSRPEEVPVPSRIVDSITWLGAWGMMYLTPEDFIPGAWFDARAET